MKTSITLVLVLLLSFPIFSQDVEIESFATGLTNPVGIENAGDERLFIIERSGYIQILSETGDLFMNPFLDINTLTSGGGESGLLGLAFHPNYGVNSYFYVNYTNNSGDTVVSRFTANSPTSDTADPSSELILMTIDQPFPNHNGGDIAFGPDGYLYIGMGDGGSGGDPGDRAQDLTNPLGKMLRIDVDNTSDGNNYAIPADNPFNGSMTLVEEIWSYGLRNPWRFSFDRDTGEIWIADVGQNAIEEINMVPLSSSGLNYGWRCYEADTVFDLDGDCPPVANLQFPVAQYTHTGSGLFRCSITGGYRYRGVAQPTLEGLYFFADYCTHEIGILEYDGADWNMSFTEQYTGNGWSSFGEDMNGEIYIAGLSSGNIYKIVDAELSIPEESLSNIKIYPNPVSDALIIDTSLSSDKIKHIYLYNLHGKRITSIFNPTESITTISTKDMHSGFYLVKITTIDGKKKINKLIKN